MCCQDPVNLGCYDSCDTITITDLTGSFAANELFVRYNFNGAVRKEMIAVVSDDGEPIIDLSLFNEDYYYTFEIVDLATGDSLGCYKMKVEPCAGDFFEAEPPVISEYLDSTIIFGAAACSGETIVEFVVDIADPQLVALIDGTIINFGFTASVPGTALEVASADANIVVLSPTSVQIVDATLITSIALQLKVSSCDTNDISAVVTSFDNLADTWGNGTHTADSTTIN